MEPTTIRRIDHISIAVRDLEKAKAFFIGVLGGRELFAAPVAPQKFRWNVTVSVRPPADTTTSKR